MFKNNKEIRDYLESNGFEDVMLFENYDYATAFVGVSYDNEAIYDYDKMLKFLEKQGMSLEEAVEFIDYNSSFRQASYPIIMYPAKK